MRVPSDVQSCKRCPLFTSVYAVRLRIFSEDLRTRPTRGRVIIITVIGLHDVYCVRLRAKTRQDSGFHVIFCTHDRRLPENPPYDHSRVL